MASIHQTAVVDPAAKIDPSVTIGAYTVVEAGVEIGAETVVGSHAVLSGLTTIGRGNTIGSFVSIGAPPQDLTYKGEPTRVVIGDGNQIREYVSIHRGTAAGAGVTIIGDENMIMAYSHVAHDCVVGNKVIMANCATLGGHVKVFDHANLGGMVAVHQFSRIGEHTYIGGMSGVSKDIPPYVIASGIRGGLRITGINKIGLRRCGYDQEDIRKVTIAFKYIFRTPDLLLREALDKAAAEFPDCEPVMHMVEFFSAPNRMGVLRRVNGD